MVNEDGIYHDRFYKLTAMISMEEVDFLRTILLANIRKQVCMKN